jgi:hypothetical protein
VTALYADAPDGQGFDSNVALTAHFNEPSSTNCRWAPGNEGSFSLDSAPADTAQFACRMSVFVTQATPGQSETIR